jgi:hypothetical protein
MDTQAQDTSLKDTVNGFVEYNGELYLSSLTKDSSDMSGVKLYKTNVDASGNTPTIAPFEEVQLSDTIQGRSRVVSAVGNEVISYGGHDYLPVCMSRSLPKCSRTLEDGVCEHTPLEDGFVVLYDMAGVQSPITVAEHNYTCTALQSVGDNLMVGGRLITQIIHEQTLEDILSGQLAQGDADFPMLYTDEMYNSVTGQYADAYYPLGVNFSGGGDQYASAITWNSGTMVQLFDDGRLGVAMGNRLIPVTGSALSEQTVITMDMDPGGMQDRIFSNIRTELANLNTSRVSNMYHEGQTTFSTDAVLPGVMYGGTDGKGGPRRTEPMALPLISEEPMDESQWKDFFLDYYDPADRRGGVDYNVAVPADGPGPCNANSIPSTCQFN